MSDFSVAQLKARAGGIKARLDEIKGQILAAQSMIVEEYRLTVQMVEGSGLDSAAGAAAQIKAAEGACDDAVAFLGLAQENLEQFQAGI